jgi:hypothetical protein
MYDFRKQDLDWAHNMIDPNIKAPYTEEFTAGISHELFRNVFVGLNYHYKQKKNIWQRTYYNVDKKEYWYHMDQPQISNYYVPFTTIVPGTSGYPDREVTVYAQKLGTTGFYRGTNIPELVSKYQGLEFIFNKRMSEGWQLSGSLVYSKAYGNLGADYSSTTGWSSYGYYPTWYVNRYGRVGTDRPLAIKLMGSVQLPYGIIFSGYYRFFSGAPWGRSTTIRVPASWLAANGCVLSQDIGVYIEPADTRRNPASNQLDFRLEKEFKFKRFGTFGAYVDVLNLLGYTYLSVGLNDISRYSPSAPNVNEPQNVIANSAYKVISGVSGLRTLRLCLRYSF